MRLNFGGEPWNAPCVEWRLHDRQTSKHVDVYIHVMPGVNVERPRALTKA